VLPEQFGGLPGSRHFFYPIGGHPVMIEQLEDEIIGTPMLPVGQERHTLPIMADEQVILEAAVELPPSVYEPLFYLFSLHYSSLFVWPWFGGWRYCVTHERSCHS
jgi:hypothetical protein